MNSEVPSGFRGLRWEPTDEQDVVVLFIERLLEFGRVEGIRTDWPETNGACFTVRGPLAGLDDVEYFKVSSTSGVLSLEERGSRYQVGRGFTAERRRWLGVVLRKWQDRALYLGSVSDKRVS